MSVSRLSWLGFLLFVGGIDASAADLTVTDGRTTLSVDELKAELLAVPQDVRMKTAANREALTRFAGNLLRDKRIAAAAREAGVAALPEVKAAVEKSTRDVLVDRYLTDQVAQKSAKAPDFRQLAKEQFEVNRASHTVPEAVRVAHILVRQDVEDERVSEADARAQAEAILAKIREGADFAQLAREMSEDKTSSARGGEIQNWVVRDKMAPPFERAAFSLKPGEVSGIVRTRYGFHVIKLIEYRPARLLEFSELEGQLVGKFRDEYMSARRDEVIEQFSGKQPVQIDDALMEALKTK